MFVEHKHVKNSREGFIDTNVTVGQGAGVE